MGSLRWAITQVNGDSSPDTIDFAISGHGGPDDQPELTVAGDHQLGASLTATTQNSSSGPPQIVINGSSLSFVGLDPPTSRADRSRSKTWRSSAVRGTGIVLTGGARRLDRGVLHRDCRRHACHGQRRRHRDLRLDQRDDRGHEHRQPGNVISGNTGKTASSWHRQAMTTPLGTLIEGNIIGLDAAGTSHPRQRQQRHLSERIRRHHDRRHDRAARNIISGNVSDGISLGTGIDSLVEGNYIGTDITGTMALGNNDRSGFHQCVVCHHRRDGQQARAT